jgi:hypothetical protein
MTLAWPMAEHVAVGVESDGHHSSLCRSPDGR